MIAAPRLGHGQDRARLERASRPSGACGAARGRRRRRRGARPRRRRWRGGRRRPRCRPRRRGPAARPAAAPPRRRGPRAAARTSRGPRRARRGPRHPRQEDGHRLPGVPRLVRRQRVLRRRLDLEPDPRLEGRGRHPADRQRLQDRGEVGERTGAARRAAPAARRGPTAAMRAWAWGLRTIAAWSASTTLRSSTNARAPVSSRGSSRRRTTAPTYLPPTRQGPQLDQTRELSREAVEVPVVDRVHPGRRGPGRVDRACRRSKSASAGAHPRSARTRSKMARSGLWRPSSVERNARSNGLYSPRARLNRPTSTSVFVRQRDDVAPPAAPDEREDAARRAAWPPPRTPPGGVPPPRRAPSPGQSPRSAAHRNHGASGGPR